MRFTVATILAFAASAMAVATDPTPEFDPINVPEKNAEIPAGKPFTVKWSNPAPYTEGPVYLQLLAGKTHDTLTVKTEKLASLDSKDQKYTWNVDPSLGNEAAYGLRLVWEKDDSIVQYSQPFTIEKAAGGDSTVTMTSSQGVKTVTLSSATTSSTTATNTTTSCLTTSTATANHTSAHNSTMVTPTMTQTTSLVPTETSSKTTPPANKPSSGAAHAAGSVAAIGGLVAALLAL